MTDEMKEFIQETKITRRPFGNVMYIYMGNRQIAEEEIEEGMTDRELDDIMYRVLEASWDYAKWRKDKATEQQ